MNAQKSTPAQIEVAVDAVDASAEQLDIQAWCQAAVSWHEEGGRAHPRPHPAPPEASRDYAVSVRLMGGEEIARLNSEFRGETGPTDVMAFPPSDTKHPAEQDEPHQLGDIALCASVIERKAKELGYPLQDHWAHVVVHGTLHLLGFDHRDDDEKKLMRAAEDEIMARLSLPPIWQ